MMEPQPRSLQAVADAGDSPTALDKLTKSIDAGVEYIEGRDEMACRIDHPAVVA